MLKQFALAATVALALGACSKNDTNQAASGTQVGADAPLIDRINNKGTITVGTEGTYAPFTYHDESGKLTGYDVEVTRAVAEKLGVKVDFKETQWDAMLAGLDAKRFDIVANQVSLTTPERQAKYDKSEPYSWSGPAALARKDDARVKSWADIKGLDAAQSLTSNYREMAEKYGAKITGVDGMAQAIELVKQKRVDLTLNDHLAILDYLKKHTDSGLEIKLVADAGELRGSGLIFRKGEDAAVAKVNEAMVELQKDGTLKKLSEQFFGEDISVK
ncbi:amino acid ABC transporter substrate-binding protein [Neisseria wadsworthii]|uniref:Polar amino acid ABC superfamily ATP binding cassette transporter, binding protein n=1 Tax=Neisseria wadsworthii 9715 TaxID=1030841 RepID=G4CQD3_9NEIS|nr:amino acid ABC transporter substrate-binding protein [Neisseria wadsworthii]EGZ46381.1 polar amino acid ABC superfamily ATP binding cassette transporter, binding protein [Neisseria wadsworthii 9715]QMT35052.1 amino acid ABC transporter substrate-binding protein [Neisseria wadsworthii]